MASPLTNPLRKDTPFTWDDVCQKAFEFLKQKLIEGSVLASPHWTKEFHIHADASMYDVGTVLCPADDNKVDHPIYYASQNLSDVERN